MTAIQYRIDGTPRTYTQLFGTPLPETYDDYGATTPVPPSGQIPAVVLLAHRSLVRLPNASTVQLPQRSQLRLPRT